MTTEHHSPWDDPAVKAALSEGRLPHDIALVCCGGCGSWVYYNEGSHADCPWCEWSVSGDALDQPLEDGEVIMLDEYEGVGPGDVP